MRALRLLVAPVLGALLFTVGSLVRADEEPVPDETDVPAESFGAPDPVFEYMRGDLADQQIDDKKWLRLPAYDPQPLEDPRGNTVPLMIHGQTSRIQSSLWYGGLLRGPKSKKAKGEVVIGWYLPNSDDSSLPSYLDAPQGTTPPDWNVKLTAAMELARAPASEKLERFRKSPKESGPEDGAFVLKFEDTKGEWLVRAVRDETGDYAKRWARKHAPKKEQDSWDGRKGLWFAEFYRLDPAYTTGHSSE